MLDLSALIAAMEKFYVDHPGTVAVLGLVLTFLTFIGPGVTAVLKRNRAVARQEPAPVVSRWAGAVLRVGAWLREMVTRLKTDPKVGQKELDEARGRESGLNATVTALRGHLDTARNTSRAMRDRAEALESELAEAKQEIERLKGSVLRARGTNTQANQASFASMSPLPVPRAAWKIARTMADGVLELSNVGGGKATNVTVDSNFPQEVTLTDAYALEAPPKFWKRFEIAPVSFLDDFNLEFHVEWFDEAGKLQREVKKPVDAK